jgi:hypothetical protein
MHDLSIEILHLVSSMAAPITNHPFHPRPRKRGSAPWLPELYAFVTIKGAGIGQNHAVARVQAIHDHHLGGGAAT